MTVITRKFKHATLKINTSLCLPAIDGQHVWSKTVDPKVSLCLRCYQPKLVENK